MKGILKFFITMIVMALALMVALPNTGQAGENEQLKKYYKDYISKCILKNQSKAGLQTSKSANLRSSGALCAQKVAFLTRNRDVLVDEMIENKIGTKPYKIDYYLNKRFYETKRLVSTDLKSPAN